MKQTFTKTLLFILLPVLWGACSSDDNNDPTGGSGNEELKISIDAPNNEVSGKGASFFLKIETNGEWSVSAADTWCTFFKTSGTGTSSVICTAQPNTTGKQRSTTISVTVGKSQQELTLTQKVGGNDPEPGKPDKYAGRIEIPQLKEGALNIFHTWTTQLNGKEVVTYSYEYDCTKKHVRWVALTFDNVTSQENVGRQDDYKTDPNIPTQYQTEKKDYYSPYNRGHMVASSDRLYSRDANSQTFYYSNISPQLISGFNEGGSTWDAIENKVQAWGKVSNPQDTTYIVKGTSIDYAILETGTYGVQIPKFYYSTILSYKNGQYKAVGFYIEHKYDKSKNMKACAMSIDDLEKKTGINFYHNLPDEIETVVEANYKESDWAW